MLDLTDEQIAARVQQGDSAAFDMLVERFEPKITRYARKFLLAADDAKDLVQDVFIKAYMNIQDFDISRRFSPWLYRIAHNEFINAIKKRSRMPSISIDADVLFPQLMAQETADSDANHSETKALLDRSLETLDPKYREPLVLFYYEEMDYRQIADVLQIPTATVGVRLKRGKTLLKKKVDEDYAAEGMIVTQKIK